MIEEVVDEETAMVNNLREAGWYFTRIPMKSLTQEKFHKWGSVRETWDNLQEIFYKEKESSLTEKVKDDVLWEIKIQV